MTTKITTIIGAVVTVALLAAYVAVTVTGHDGTAILTLTAGWIGGSATPAITSAVKRPEGNE